MTCIHCKTLKCLSYAALQRKRYRINRLSSCLRFIILLRLGFPYHKVCIKFYSPLYLLTSNPCILIGSQVWYMRPCTTPLGHEVYCFLHAEVHNMAHFGALSIRLWKNDGLFWLKVLTILGTYGRYGDKYPLENQSKLGCKPKATPQCVVSLLFQSIQCSSLANCEQNEVSFSVNSNLDVTASGGLPCMTWHFALMCKYMSRDPLPCMTRHLTLMCKCYGPRTLFPAWHDTSYWCVNAVVSGPSL